MFAMPLTFSAAVSAALLVSARAVLSSGRTPPGGCIGCAVFAPVPGGAPLGESLFTARRPARDAPDRPDHIPAARTDPAPAADLFRCAPAVFTVGIPSRPRDGVTRQRAAAAGLPAAPAAPRSPLNGTGRPDDTTGSWNTSREAARCRRDPGR